jgi:hypothetical protein
VDRKIEGKIKGKYAGVWMDGRMNGCAVLI